MPQRNAWMPAVKKNLAVAVPNDFSSSGLHHSERKSIPFLPDSMPSFQLSRFYRLFENWFPIIARCRLRVPSNTGTLASSLFPAGTILYLLPKPITLQPRQTLARTNLTAFGAFFSFMASYLNFIS